jgi:hypothetical protein
LQLLTFCFRLVCLPNPVFDDDRGSNHRQIECLEVAYRGRSVARA